jgi:beta-lactamase class D/pimeloyl-ACP methyl ester carboxylesterase
LLALALAAVLASPAAAEEVVERPDLAAVFREYGMPGTFVLYDAGSGRMTVVDRARAERRFVPASTFKIANSLIALETGAVRDEREVIPYGGQPQPFKSWEKDMDLREAIRASNVAVYQEVARRIGPARMQSSLERLGYGNQRIGSVVDRFWLDGPLEISAVEQARFAAQLARQSLPLSARSQSIVRDILRLEDKDGASLFGKTGWIFDRAPQLGWWTGWVERGGRIHSFALNVDMASAEDAPKRVALGRALLARLGVLEAQAPSAPPAKEALGIALEGLEYPHPVAFLPLKVEGQDVRLAYMDVPPRGAANGRTVLLLHGKNFFGGYWKDTIAALAAAGYRVVVPDQVGFGKSSKPDAPYTFQRLAWQTRAVLDALGVRQVAVVGHSMGGMLAARFALQYPERVTRLVLENPIGLEDYRGGKVPPASLEELYQEELKKTEEAIRAAHKAYYVQWKPEYETYVQAQYRCTLSGEYPRLARVSARTSQMIYEQPVVQDLPQLRMPVLLVIGQEDRTAPGKNRAPEGARARLGQYPELGRAAARAIPNATLVPLPGVGHVPHFEAAEDFHRHLLAFLEGRPVVDGRPAAQ